jgi:hypothetical protein
VCRGVACGLSGPPGKCKFSRSLGCLCRPHTDAISTSVIGKKPAKAALGAWKLDA